MPRASNNDSDSFEDIDTLFEELGLQDDVAADEVADDVLDHRGDKSKEDVNTFDLEATLDELAFMEEKMSSIDESVDSQTQELESTIKTLQEQIAQGAWIPQTEHDYLLVKKVQDTAIKAPSFFSDEARRGFLPLCPDKRREIVRLQATVEKDLKYIQNLS